MKKKIVSSLLLIGLVLVVGLGPVSCSSPVEQQQQVVDNGTWGISDFPDPRSFTQEIVNLPNPFISWHGNTVTAANWDLRRAEIAQIMQHYMYGYQLPTAKSEPGKRVFTEIVSIATGTGARTITFKSTREDTGVSRNWTSTLPSGAIPAGEVPEGGWPVLIGIGSGGYASTTAAGYVRLQYTQAQVDSTDKGGDTDSTPIVKGVPSASGNRTADVVISLFPETNRFSGVPGPNDRFNPEEYRHPTDYYDWISDYGDLDAPGCMMNWAWGISLMLDAFEAENLKPEEERLIYINPLRAGVFGVSRLGKTALIAAAYDERILGCAPMSTCAGGLNIDRFVSIAVNAADSRSNLRSIDAIGKPDLTLEYTDFTYPASGRGSRPAGQTSTSWAPYNLDKVDDFGPFDGYGYINKYYQYMKWDDTVYAGNMKSYKTVTAKEALIDPTRDINGGFPVDQQWPTGEMTIVWSEGTPSTTNVFAMSNLKEGYGVHRYTLQGSWVSPADPGFVAIQRPWAPQPMPDHRWRYPTSYASRYFQMPLIYNHLNVHTREHAGDWGYFANAPWDQHFMSALVAPRVLLMAGGHNDANGGHEAAFMNYLASKEIYAFLGATDRVGIVANNHGHAGAEQEALDLISMMDDAWFDRPTADLRLVPDRAQDYPYPINDPRSRYDYVKLDWAAPGRVPLSERVALLVPADATSWDDIILEE